MPINKGTATHRPLSHLLVLSLVLLCLTVLAGCSISLVESASSPRTQPPPPFAKRLRPLLEAKMKELQIPGAMVFVDLPGQGSWTTTLGTSNLKTGIPMNPNSY